MNLIGKILYAVRNIGLGNFLHIRRLTLTITRPQPGQISSGLLYSDAGDGFGPHRLDIFQLEPSGSGGWQLDWASQGEYAWPYDEVEVHLVGFNAAWVEADGRRLPLIESRAASGVFNRLVIQSGEN